MKYYNFYDIVFKEKNNKQVFIKLENTSILDNGRLKQVALDEVKRIAH